jgi:hypothetical protein
VAVAHGTVNKPDIRFHRTSGTHRAAIFARKERRLPGSSATNGFIDFMLASADFMSATNAAISGIGWLTGLRTRISMELLPKKVPVRRYEFPCRILYIHTGICAIQ